MFPTQPAPTSGVLKSFNKTGLGNPEIFVKILAIAATPCILM